MHALKEVPKVSGYESIVLFFLFWQIICYLGFEIRESVC